MKDVMRNYTSIHWTIIVSFCLSILAVVGMVVGLAVPSISAELVGMGLSFILYILMFGSPVFALVFGILALFVTAKPTQQKERTLALISFTIALLLVIAEVGIVFYLINLARGLQMGSAH